MRWMLPTRNLRNLDAQNFRFRIGKAKSDTATMRSLAMSSCVRSGGSRISRWGGGAPTRWGGRQPLTCTLFGKKTYVKTKEIDPVGVAHAVAPPGSANGTVHVSPCMVVYFLSTFLNITHQWFLYNYTIKFSCGVSVPGKTYPPRKLFLLRQYAMVVNSIIQNGNILNSQFIP